MTENTVAEEKVEVSEKLQGIIDQIEKLTVLELSDLVKALEDKFGVTASAPVASVGAMMAGPAAGGEEAEKEEKTSFNVVLKSSGDKKIQVIKEVRAITGLGLKEAKELVDGAPKNVKEGATKEEAEKIKSQLESAGATVELK
ncbi:MAG: 50S ribosomal protein L7/L12 [Candidatus Aureabacteria bacterium]|nr:50S ribosomal protein L7/L12 [Candidatus Auribacterota bacterium]